jgi:hypothetical protein
MKKRKISYLLLEIVPVAVPAELSRLTTKGIGLPILVFCTISVNLLDELSPVSGFVLRKFTLRFRLNIVACRTVAMQRRRDGRIYQGRFWETAW